MWNRAAQFAPFAALTGYDAAIQEATEQRESAQPASDPRQNCQKSLCLKNLNTLKTNGQKQCKPSTESSLYAEMQPAFAKFICKDNENYGIIIIFAQ